MNQNLTEIVAIIDRSGSMGSIAAEASGAFNRLIAEQRALPGACNITLIQFDDQYEVVHDGISIADVPLFTIVPRGMTAMNDAIGKAIQTVGERLATTPEDDRPARVMVVIVTDGQENSSREYTPAAVKTMIELQQKAYAWKFEFLAANIDTVQAAITLGIPAESSITYDASAEGTQDVYRGLSVRIGAFRGGE